MERYFIADCVQTDDGLTLTAQIEIDKTQYQEMNSWFNFANYYHTCRSVARMTKESGQDFIDFCERSAAEHGGHDDLEIDDFLITGNKLLISYLSFVRMFVDVISKAIKDKKQEMLKVFQKFNREMYDSFFGYRLLTRMRNYVLHYEMPLTAVTDSVEHGIVFTCDKDNLLRYDRWSTLKSEIDALPKRFSILPMISECQSAIDTLFLKALEIIADDVFSGNEKLVAFCRQHNIRSPIILILDDSTDAPPKLRKFPLHILRKYVMDLNRHPSYEIDIINE